jgi:hypothetical protein
MDIFEFTAQKEIQKIIIVPAYRFLSHRCFVFLLWRIRPPKERKMDRRREGRGGREEFIVPQPGSFQPPKQYC